ncbi:Predicted membrane protein [Modestobacter sp. DSM 44400]|uniref:DUF2254 family protein n=1 Tax=Modestobacter sp. DSM 44400 TaxID=1550230 RepID=UPI00089C9FCC|nr:DUF2254 family protein [Modestobacter sp. DSM 44400]SDX90400.1 Predicted membrane protein [Modestobacter sp. DSM 44400]
MRTDVRRLGREFADLAATPLLIVGGFVLLTSVSLIADQTTGIPALNGLRSAAGRVIGADAAATALQAVATGLVTITSITFSVLLLAVQQTASNLSPVVFDQFIRRKSNQAFLGFFVGLAIFSYVVLAAGQESTPPILGAALATVLTVVALLSLLRLVYSTISQMRPTSVIRAIHDRTLTARDREAVLVRRTIRQSRSPHPVRARQTSSVSGYVTHLSLEVLAAALDSAQDAEVCLQVTVGDHIGYGELLATVRDADPARAQRIAEAVAAAIHVTGQRNLADDPTTGIDELGNIAWTSGSTSKQNPEIAREATLALRDLALRWLLDDPVDEHGTDHPRLAVVYRDNDLDRILDVLYSMFVVSHESHQHMLAADVLDTYRSLLDRADGPVADRLLRDVAVAEQLLDQDPPSPVLRLARRSFDRARAERESGQ